MKTKSHPPAARSPRRPGGDQPGAAAGANLRHKRKPRKPAPLLIGGAIATEIMSSKGIGWHYPRSMWSIKNAKRLHSWLGRAIAWIEAQR